MRPRKFSGENVAGWSGADHFTCFNEAPQIQRGKLRGTGVGQCLGILLQ